MPSARPTASPARSRGASSRTTAATLRTGRACGATRPGRSTPGCRPTLPSIPATAAVRSSPRTAGSSASTRAPTWAPTISASPFRPTSPGASLMASWRRAASRAATSVSCPPRCRISSTSMRSRSTPACSSIASIPARPPPGPACAAATSSSRSTARRSTDAFPSSFRPFKTPSPACRSARPCGSASSARHRRWRSPWSPKSWKAGWARSRPLRNGGSACARFRALPGTPHLSGRKRRPRT